MVGELTEGDDSGERGFLLRVHLGNYSLWLAGLFPDYVAARRNRQGGPDLPYYDELGRQGYHLASEHRLAERFGVAGIYRAAAQRFPTLRVRSEERRGGRGGGGALAHTGSKVV